MTTRANTAFCWPGLRSTGAAPYLSRRIGRSQNGVAGGSSWPLDRLPPWSADSAGGAGAGFGRARPPDRWRGPALGHPLAGQAGPPPADPPEPPEPPGPPQPRELRQQPGQDGRGAGRLTGGAVPPLRPWLLTGGADDGAGGADARGRGPVPADPVPADTEPAETGPAERPAPRD